MFNPQAVGANGVPASAKILFPVLPTAGDTVTINGTVFTFGVNADFYGRKTRTQNGPAPFTDRDQAALVTNLANKIQATNGLGFMAYAEGPVLWVVATTTGTAANAWALSTSNSTAITVPATFSNGSAGTVAAAPGGTSGQIQINNAGVLAGTPTGAGVLTALGNGVNTTGGLVTSSIFSTANTWTALQTMAIGAAPPVLAPATVLQLQDTDTTFSAPNPTLTVNKDWTPSSDNSGTTPFAFESRGFIYGANTLGGVAMVHGTGTNRGAKPLQLLEGFTTHLGNQSNSIGGYSVVATATWTSGASFITLSAVNPAVLANMFVVASNGAIPFAAYVTSVSGTQVNLFGNTTALGTAVTVTFYSSVVSLNHFTAYSPVVDVLNPIITAAGLYIQKQSMTGVTKAYGIFQMDTGDTNQFNGPTTVGNGGTSVAFAVATPTGKTSIGDVAECVHYTHTSGNINWYAGLVTPAAAYDGLYHIDCFNGSSFVKLISVSQTGDITTSGNLIIGTVGMGFQIKGGTNARIGTSAAMVAATGVTVATTSLALGDQIHVTLSTIGGTPGAPYVATRTNGTGFTVKSTSSLDTSTIDWYLVKQI